MTSPHTPVVTASVARRAVARLRGVRRHERGYVAVLIAILVPVAFLGLCAVAVDTSRWFVEVQKVQNAADAAALAGVVWMPGDPGTAKATALAEASKNGYTASSEVSIEVVEGDKPTQLKATVTSTIPNVFGKAIGTPTTTITRSATADYQGGLSMGSPCNLFGDDPDATSTTKSTNCDDVGAFWANVGSKSANKGSGDAFQNGVCGSEDGCTNGANTDYDANGYFYTITNTAAMSNLRIEVFDPALVHVGDQCEASELDNAKNITAANAVVADPSTRYSDDDNGPYCTGDVRFGGTGEVSTSYTVRYRGAGSDPARPWTWPIANSSSCAGAKTYNGFKGNLAHALDKSRVGTGYDSSVASVFRRWVQICTISTVPKDTTYVLQVKTNGLGTDAASGHNRFALRAYSTSSSAAKDKIAIAAFDKMAIYANLDQATTTFFLTRVPSTAAGQTLEVKLFDIGDIGGGSADVKIVAPAESGVSFTNCRAVGKSNATLSDCQLHIDSAFNGKWQTIYVPIPSGYTCTDSVPTGCWVKLDYDLRSANRPADTTSWASSLNGDPVRLVK